MSGKMGGGRRSRSVADPSWYESEFSAGDMMLDPTSSSTLYEDDPLHTLRPDNSMMNGEHYYLENGNADPVVEAGREFRDDPNDVGGETDEIIQRKGSTGVGRHSVKKYLWCAAAFIVFILVVVVPIAVIVPRNKQAAAAPKDPLQQSYWTLKDPPSDLGKWCTSTDPNSADYINCGTYCNAAKCCDIPATDFDTCLNPDDPNIGARCLSYQKSCSARPQSDDSQDDDLFDEFDNGTITSSTYVPEAPVNLPDICNPKYFSSNTIVRLCAQQCAVAQCCWKALNDTNACLTNPNCGGYGPCAFLMASNNVHSAVSQSVHDKCQPSAVSQDRESCVAVCAVAKCCFTSDTTPDVYTDEQGCFGKPEGFCEQYTACSVLMEKIVGADDDSYGFDDDANDIGLQVDPTTGLLTPTDNNNGATEDPFEDASNYQLQKPPVNMGVICDPNLVFTNDDSMQQCQDLCIDASCCYLPSLDPNSCLDTLLDVCMQYRSYCDFVFEAPTQNATVTDTSSTVDLDVGNTSYLLDVCSPYSLSTPTGMKACAAACNNATCCYATVANPTTDSYAQCRAHENCDSYAPCLNLKSLTPSGNEIAQGSIPDTIKTMCANLTTQQGLAACQSVCMQHHCCFEDDWDCANAMGAYPGVDDAALQDACQLYEGCKELFQGKSGTDLWSGAAPAPTLTGDQLAAACDETRLAQGDKAECESACQQADCCEIPENIPGSCLMNNYDVCMLYHKECSALVGVDYNSNAEVPAAPQELVAFCSVASLATDYGRQKCQQDCERAKCCWSTQLDSGVVSCRDNGNCPNYAPCLALAASETVSNTTITQQIEQSCTIADAQSQQAIQDVAACRAVCLQHRCCWYKEETDDACFEKAACDQYGGCKYLIEHP